jgi:FkbM family methyltransferase
VDPSFLANLLSPTRLTEVVDVGSNPIDGDPPYKAMLSEGLCRVTGFEPQDDALARLVNGKGDHERYFSWAIGDGRKHALNICAASGMTSFFELDPNAGDAFALFKSFGAVVRRVEVETKRLDDVSEVEHLDLLKIDVQGAELQVFTGGRSKLAEAVTIHTEISFVNLYHGQPSFGEIDLELRQQGFVPHCLASLKKWPIAPCVVNNDPRQALNQLLEADVAYVRDFTRPALMTSDQLKHLALIAHHCYASFDLTLRCLAVLETRGTISSSSQGAYLEALRGPR